MVKQITHATIDIVKGSVVVLLLKAILSDGSCVYTIKTKIFKGNSQVTTLADSTCSEEREALDVFDRMVEGLRVLANSSVYS
jgi:hypothetical protein